MDARLGPAGRGFRPCPWSGDGCRLGAGGRYDGGRRFGIEVVIDDPVCVDCLPLTDPVGLEGEDIVILTPVEGEDIDPAVG